MRTRIGSILRNAKEAKEQIKKQETEAQQYDQKIEKQFSFFKYRDVIPLLHQTIISALPNEKNTPEQASLYRAFANGDVEEVMKVPRNDRKQIFITNMSIYFSTDLPTAEFGGADLWRNSLGLPGEGEMMGSMGRYMPDSSRYPMSTQTQTAEERKVGFVITIAGYSPYGRNTNEFGRLLDPHGVEDDRSEWGFVTRLEHLEDFFDGESPFELYERTDPKQLSLEMKEVTISDETPPGVGERSFRYKTTITEPGEDAEKEEVLRDPMTNEIISTIAVLDEYGRQKLGPGGNPLFKVNDHWFVLNFKLLWKVGPEFPKKQLVNPYDSRSMMMMQQSR